MRAIIQSLRYFLLGILTSFALVRAVLSAGFEAEIQTVSALGAAKAGAAAVAENVGHQFYNPALLSEFDRPTLSMSSQLVFFTTTYKDNGSVDVLSNPLEGEGNVKPTTALVPSLYYALPVFDDLTYGLSINTPFASTVKYDEGWIGRYNSMRTELVAYNFNPAVSYKLTESIIIGLGLNFQYVDANLASALNAAAFCDLDSTVSQLACLNIENALLEGQDVVLHLPITSWGAGWNAGLLFKLPNQTHIGLNYRSAIYHDGKGSIKVDVPVDSEGLDSILSVAPTGFVLDLDFPMSASLSFKTYAGYDTELLADVTFVDWSTFQVFELLLDPSGESIVIEHKWKDSWRFAVGAQHQFSETTKFRLGVAYDINVIKDFQYRTSIVPDSNRFWLSTGMNYKFNQNVDFDIAYAHVFAPPVPTKNVGITGDVLIGEFNSQGDFLGMQLNYHF